MKNNQRVIHLHILMGVKVPIGIIVRENKMKEFKVEILIALESGKGLSYWVKFVKENGETICPYMTYHLERAIHEACAYARFFELPEPIVIPNEAMGLTKQMINDAWDNYNLLKI
jgi:hypothetical protein